MSEQQLIHQSEMLTQRNTALEGQLGQSKKDQEKLNLELNDTTVKLEQTVKEFAAEKAYLTERECF